jgi:uncharacterized protein
MSAFIAAAVTAASCAQTARPPYAPPAPIGGKSYAPYPNPDTRYLADRGGVLTAAQKDELNRLLSDAERRSGVRIVVATVASVKDYPGTPNDSIDSFGPALFTAYQIPGKGALLLVALKDRQAHIQLGVDYGQTRDADVRKIMADVIVPRLHGNDFSGGLVEGARALATALAAPKSP